jgi:hypothetical protein
MADETAATAATREETFADYELWHSIFWVTANGLSVRRAWDDQSGEPRFDARLVGRARARHGEVRIIGESQSYSEFDLVFRPIEGNRRWIAPDESKEEGTDTPERLQVLINRRLAKKPPTASLGIWASGEFIQPAQQLDCQLSAGTLQQLEADVLAGRVEQVELGIEWIGLHRVSGFGSEWGLFRVKEDRQPEPLRGHVTHVSWILATEHTRIDAAAEGAAGAQVDQHLRKWLANSEAEQLKDEKGHRVRYANAAIDAAKAVAAWFKQHDNPNDPDRIAYHLEYRLEEAVRFVQNLDQALHPDKSKFADDTYKLWFHRDFKRFYSFAKKPSQRGAAINRTGLAIYAGEYLEHPEFHTPYLDWVLIDALTFAEIVSTIEALAEQKIGWAYELADGSLLKLYGYKALGWGLWLIGIAISWGWPAAVVYLNYGSMSPWGIAGLTAYYALLLISVLVGIGRKVRRLFSLQPSAIQRLEKRILEMERTYHVLGTDRISDRVRVAFDRAFENGVFWNPQIFQILDAAARQ